jgi:GTPase
VIGAPVVVKKEEEVAAAVAVPEKELEKLAVSDTKKEEKKATKEEKKVMEEQAVEEEEDTTYDSREHLNLVFIGHVDAGKSTIGGQILLQGSHRVSQIPDDCFTEAGDCCPYIAIYNTDTSFLQSSRHGG